MHRAYPLLALASLLFVAAPASADLVVAPTALSATEGNSAYGFSVAGAFTFQQVYGGSQLAGLSPGDQITGVQFRLNGGQPTGPATALSVTNFDVYLGPSNFAPGSLSNSVAGNQGVGTTLTRGGTLDIPVNSFPGGPGPNAFGLFIPFTTPFTYTGGDLLLTLSYTAPGGNLEFDGGLNLEDVQGRSGEGYNNPLVPNSFANYALVTQFTTAAVPEPGSLMMFGAGTVLAALVFRQRRGAGGVANEPAARAGGLRPTGR